MVRTSWTFLALAAFLALAQGSHVYAQQVVRVGANPVAPPVSFHDPQTNSYRGIAVELIAAIGKDAGFEVQYTGIPLGDLITALNGNKIDVIAANMRILPERKALIDFSESYHTGADALIVPKTDTRQYNTVEDLKGMALGVQRGSAQHADLQKLGLFPDLKLVESFGEVMREVGAGRIDGGIVGATGARYEQHLGRYQDVRIVTSYRPPTPAVGIAYGVRKTDSELLQRINSSLARLHANGTVKKILAEYGL